MPSWTLGDIISNATTRAGRRSELAASTVSFWVNQAIQDFLRDVPELQSEKTASFSVSSGDSLLTLPADFREPINFSYQTTGYECKALPQISPERADSEGYYPVGEPKGWFIYNDKIQLWPSANSSVLTTHASSGRSYLLRYRAGAPTDISATTAVPSIATEHRIGVLFKTEQYIHELVGNIEEAAASQIRYTGFAQAVKDSFARRQMAKDSYKVALGRPRGRR